MHWIPACAGMTERTPEIRKRPFHSSFLRGKNVSTKRRREATVAPLGGFSISSRSPVTSCACGWAASNAQRWASPALGASPLATGSRQMALATRSVSNSWKDSAGPRLPSVPGVSGLPNKWSGEAWHGLRFNECHNVAPVHHTDNSFSLGVDRHRWGDFEPGSAGCVPEQEAHNSCGGCVYDLYNGTRPRLPRIKCREDGNRGAQASKRAGIRREVAACGAAHYN